MRRPRPGRATTGSAISRSFRLGDIHTVELPPAAFDVVIGLDSWCHIPQCRPPSALRAAAASGQEVAFYDHVVRQPLAEDHRQRFCAVWRFADLESPASYLQGLEAAGLEPLRDRRQEHSRRRTRPEVAGLEPELQCAPGSGYWI
jgi:hypothetical protein